MMELVKIILGFFAVCFVLSGLVAVLDSAEPSDKDSTSQHPGYVPLIPMNQTSIPAEPKRREQPWQQEPTR
jgi:hypothetical protein